MKNNLFFSKGLISKQVQLLVNKTKYILSRESETRLQMFLKWFCITDGSKPQNHQSHAFLSSSCRLLRKKEIPKVVFFVKTWNVLSKLGSGKEMIFFSSLFCLSRRERLFYFDYYLFIFLNLNSFHCEQQIPKHKKRKQHFFVPHLWNILSLSFFYSRSHTSITFSVALFRIGLPVVISFFF